jgi:UTP--glucose-1-phosphate uridylyltransferase
MASLKVRKAVIPAAGMGTRFLPATKATPKEMLPLVDKPLIQYAVEEAVAAGCTEVIIVTGRNKATMEDHFDKSPELEASLTIRHRPALLEIAQSVTRLARVVYTRQSEPLGLGHAVLQAKHLVGDEPFAVILPDDVVDSAVPCLKQMVDAFHEAQSSILASEVVERAAISHYGCLACTTDPRNPRLLDVSDMVEKPKPEEAPSLNAIIGRYILTPRIFEMIEKTKPGAGGEIQLTDAIRTLLQHEKVYGFSYEGKRHDAGDKFGFLKATVEFALKHKELGPRFHEWLTAQQFYNPANGSVEARVFSETLPLSQGSVQPVSGRVV